MKQALRAAGALAVAIGIVSLLAPDPREPADVAAEQPEPEIEPTPIRVAIATPEPSRVAHTEPAPVPPEPVSRPAPPPPPPAAAPEPAIVTPGERALRRGAALLDSGSFPRLRATYERIGFEAYRDAMRELGARFYVFDPRARQPLAEVDPRSNRLDGDARPPADLSRWPRDVTRHLPAALARGRSVYGERAGRVILLPPRALDAALLGALDARLRASSLRSGDTLGVRVAYELRGGRLHAAVLGVTLRDGSERALPLVIDLSRAELAS